MNMSKKSEKASYEGDNISKALKEGLYKAMRKLAMLQLG